MYSINDFVDINGRNIIVRIDENGHILVPLEEIIETGFRIIPKKQYNSLLVDRTQIFKEFNLYLLGAAKTYLLSNRVQFNEQQVLNTIEKLKLLNETPPATLSCPEVKSSCESCLVNGDIKRSSLSLPDQDSFEKYVNPTGHKSIGTPSTNSSYSSISQFTHYTDTKSIQEQTKSLSTPKPHIQKPYLSKNYFALQQEYDVTITFFENIEGIVWVRDDKNISTYENIVSTLMSNSDKNVPVPNPIVGNIYCVQDKDQWYRCKVQYPEPLIVQFVDNGNIKPVPQVFVLQHELQSIDFQAVRIFIPVDIVKTTKIGSKITICPHRLLHHGIYDVKIISDQGNRMKPPFTPDVIVYAKSESSIECSLEESKLIVNDKILISDYLDDGRLILRSRKDYEYYTTIMRVITQYNLPQKILPHPRKGFMSLYSTSSMAGANEKCFRVSILNVDEKNKYAKVTYLDYYKTATIPLEDLKTMSKELQSKPKTFQLCPPLEGFNNRPFDQKMKTYLNNLIQSKEKLLITNLSDESISLKSMGDDGDLSEKLMSLEPSSQNVIGLQEKSLEVINDTPRTKLGDMKISEPTTKTFEAMIGHFKDIGNFTFIEWSTQNEVFLENVMIASMDDILDSYTPIIEEVCLGYFEECWYRTVIIKDNDPNFECLFVDFGNTETLDLTKLRPLPNNLKSIPILGVKGRVVGIQPEQLPKFTEYVKSDGNKLLELIKFNGDKYDVKFLDF